jgi:hypothetical protein
LHYRYARRTREDAGPPKHASSTNGGYDAHFCACFLDELEQHGWPRYPDNPWFSALRRADYEYRRLGSLGPLLPASHVPESSGLCEELLAHRDYEDLSRSVDLGSQGCRFEPCRVQACQHQTITL